MSLGLNYYKTMLLSVKTQVVGGKRKVAKPVLLLAIIQAIRDNLLTDNQIKYSDELEGIYKGLYAKYGESLSPMKYPFYHLTSDGFYHIKGQQSRQRIVPETKTGIRIKQPAHKRTVPVFRMCLSHNSEHIRLFLKIF